MVEDWLEHYRMALGMASPHLKGVRDAPVAASRARLIKSAKLPSSGVRAIIESLATSVPSVTLSQRVPSAPPGECIVKLVMIHLQHRTQTPEMSSIL